MEKCYVIECTETTFRKCILCKRPCCPAHKSKQDADYCQDCYTEETTKLEEGPLVGADGVTVDGRSLKPVGQFYVTFPGYVHKLSNELLDKCIEEYALRVNEARVALDKARVNLTVAQTEKSDREAQSAIPRKRQPGLVLTTDTGQTVRIGAAENKQQRAAQVVARLKALGLSEADIVEKLREIVAKRQKG